MAETPAVLEIPQDFRELIKTQFERVSDKVDNLTTLMDRNFGELRNMVNDHEQRLRKQSEVDGAQAKDISDLRVSIETLNGKITGLAADVASLKQAEGDRSKSELGFWQRMAIEAVRFAVFGGAAGGVIVAAMRAMNIV